MARQIGKLLVREKVVQVRGLAVYLAFEANERAGLRIIRMMSIMEPALGLDQLDVLPVSVLGCGQGRSSSHPSVILGHRRVVVKKLVRHDPVLACRVDDARAVETLHRQALVNARAVAKHPVHIGHVPS